MIFDAAVYLGAWPFRAIEGTVPGLTRTMDDSGIGQAILSPLDGLFHEDPQSANQRVLRQIRGRPGLWAAPLINLRITGWQGRAEDFARLPQVRALRFAPTFHGYPVEALREAAHCVAQHGLTAVVQLRLSDERFHPVFLDLPAASLEQVIALASETPSARWVVSAPRLGEITSLGEQVRQTRNLWLDTSHVDGLDCMRRACDAVGPERLLFSTCWPFFYTRSALLKMEEAGLSAEESRAVMSANAAAAFSTETAA